MPVYRHNLHMPEKWVVGFSVIFLKILHTSLFSSCNGMHDFPNWVRGRVLDSKMISVFLVPCLSHLPHT